MAPKQTVPIFAFSIAITHVGQYSPTRPNGLPVRADSASVITDFGPTLSRSVGAWLFGASFSLEYSDCLQLEPSKVWSI
jgi:hypothetical protein